MKAIEKIKKEIRKRFFFYQPNIDIEGNDLYFCTCGNAIKVNPMESKYVFNVDDLSSFGQNFDLLNQGFKKVEKKCDKCKKDFSLPENYKMIQPCGINFLERFHLEKTKTKITLHKYKISSTYYDLEQAYTINVDDVYIEVLKSSKRIRFYDNKGEVKNVQLENLVSVVSEFFEKDTNVEIIEQFVFLHEFIGIVATLIMDSKNMNIIEELLNQMVGKSGLDILQKIITIFLGILIYPNLSTLSLTKDNVFLYDVLTKCPLPSAKFLKWNKATSPLKIFNTLVSIKNETLQSELDSDDRSKLGYAYKAKDGRTFQIYFEKNELDSSADNIVKEGGKLFVRDNITDKTISPYIFNKIKSFDQYTKLIQWLKLISYNNLIQLVMKYDIDFLIAIFEQVEFREDINMPRLQQFITLIQNYIQSIRNIPGAIEDSSKLLQEEVVTGETTTNIFKELNAQDKDFLKRKKLSEKSDLEIISSFDFSIYDDCMRMLIELNWSPNKVLYKTKTLEEIKLLHDNLMKHRSYVASENVNQKYIDFAQNFKYLESYGGPLKIEVIETPKQLLDEAISLHNCAGSFIRRVANKEYVAFIVYDKSPKRTKEEYYKYMMVLEIGTIGLDFVGIKTYCNQFGSDRFKQDVRDYLIEKDISFKEVPSIKFGVQSNEMSYSGTFEKIESSLNIKNKETAQLLNKAHED